MRSLKKLLGFNNVDISPVNGECTEGIELQAGLDNADILIHIGAPKTGSSAIQYFCNHNRKLLLDNGIYYPKHSLDSNGISGGHWDLANFVVEQNLDGAKNILAEYLKKAKKNNSQLLISAESFFVRPNDLLKILPSDSFHIISFFRHPMEAFKSHYNQGVKRHFSTNTIKKVAMSIERTRPGITGEVLLRWAELVGVKRMSLIPYSSMDTNNDSVKNICDLLKIPFSAVKNAKINTSYTPCALEFKRMINSVIDPENTRLNSKLDVLLQKYSDASNPPSPSLQQMVGSVVYEDLENYFKPILNRISKVFSVKFPLGTHSLAGADFESIDLIWEKIQENNEISAYIKASVLKYLFEKDRSYDLAKLAQYIDIPFEELELIGGKANITDKELNLVLAGSAQLPDVLREMAKILERSGDIKNALRVSERALELRPSGPYLQAMVKRLQCL